MGRACIRARRSGRGRWCRFLRGIVPGRDAPGSEPTTPLSRDARGSRGCTLAARTIRTPAFIEVLTPHTRARTLSSWMRRFGARDVSRVTYGTIRERYRRTQYGAVHYASTSIVPRCAYAPCDNARIGYVSSDSATSFRTSLRDFAGSRPTFTAEKISREIFDHNEGLSSQ